jgi:hypothetical protein
MWDEETVIIPTGVVRSDRANISLPITSAALPATQRLDLMLAGQIPLDKVVRTTIIAGGFLLTTAVFLMVSSILG